MNVYYERALAWLLRDVTDWRYGVLAVIAMREAWEGYYGGEGAPEPSWPDVQGLMGQAGRRARLEYRTNPVHTRKGTSLAGMKAADESQRRYQGADAEYAIRDRDLREWTLREAMGAVQRTLVNLPEDQVREACETLQPLVVKLLDKGVIRGQGPRAKNHATIAANLLEKAQEKVLRDLGTVAGTKASRMKPSTPIPHSGTASRAVVIGDPGSGKCWEVYPDRYEQVPLEKALQALYTTDTLPAAKPGWQVLRREASDEALANLKRPVVKPGRNSGKQKGRVGGPMVVRGGRP